MGTIFVSTATIMNDLQKTILDGQKIPHSISQPVVRNVDGRYYLAVFIFFFSKKDIEEKKISRPEMWALLNLVNGSIEHKYNCRTDDFCDENFKNRYSIITDSSSITSKNYLTEIWSLMDSVRLSCIEGKINQDLYKAYLTEVLRTIPQEYRVFYNRLSIMYGKC